MELKIYNQADELKLTVSPNTSSTVTEEVMGECAVNAGFTHTEFVMLDVNDYIDIEGIRYRIMAQYRPKQKNTQTYEYSVKFYAPIHQAENTLMLFTPDNEMTSEFSYDGGPREHLQLWIDNMNRIAGVNVWKIGTVITAENKVIEYKNVKCWDAAFGSNGIAAAFDTEMWADGYYINLCKAERGERVDLGYLQGLTSLQQEENGEVKFFTRLFPLGSTRNIDASKYGHSRLQLPGGVQFVDKNVDIYGVKEEFEEEAFSDIYPKYIGKVQSVRTENLTNTEGRDYTVYYIKDAAIPFNPNDYEIAEYTKMIAFQTGELAGRGDDKGSFQANWHEDTKEWEINNTYPDEDTQIPGGLIVPKPGDTYIPWNFRMPDEYNTLAEQEFLEAVNDYLNEYSFDTNKYSGQTDRNHIENNNIKLMIGLNVRLQSDTYFAAGYKDTRITKVVRQLNDLYQAAITCTDKIGEGWKKSVDNSINSLKYEVAKSFEQTVVDIIKTGENKTASDYNVFSALKSLATFLRKDRPDVTNHLLKLLGGIITSDIKTDDLVFGALGTGYGLLKTDSTGKSYFEIDKLFVRLKAVFAALEIMELTYSGGNYIFGPAGARCTRVEEFETYFRCYFTADDGSKKVKNKFRVDDFVQCREFNIEEGVHENVSNKYYWRRCVSIGEDYIDLSKADRDMISDDIPADGDNMVTIGNKTDASRQNVIIISVYGEGSPSFIQYSGINTYSLEGKAKTIISPSRNEFRGTFLFESGDDVKGYVDGEFASVRSDVAQLKIKDQEIVLSVSSTQSAAEAAKGTASNALNTANAAQNTAKAAQESVAQIKVQVGNISLTVSSVEDKADAAQSTASSAASTASSAYNTANAAQNTAKAAQESVAQIKVQVGNISLTVSSVEDKADAAQSTASSAASTASSAYNTAQSANSTASSAASTASSALSKADNALEKAENAQSKASSAITQVSSLQVQVGSITSTVSRFEDGNELVSIINQTATSITIAASKINFHGFVSINEGFKVNTDGSLSVNSGQIGLFSIVHGSLISQGDAHIKLKDDDGGYVTIASSTSPAHVAIYIARSGDGMRITNYGSSYDGTSLYINRAGAGLAIESYGGALFIGNADNTIEINGLQLNSRTIYSNTYVQKNDDVIISKASSTIYLYLSNTEVIGKVLVVKKAGAGNVVIKGNIVHQSNATWSQDLTISDYPPRIFINTSIGWIELSGKHA